MSAIVVLVVAAAAVAFGLLLAYLPMRLLMARMAKGIAEPIKAFIQRQRDRRSGSRETPDRRNSA